MLTLTSDHFWISPYVFSSFVALREMGIAFDTRVVALETGEQLRADYQDKTITGRVPSLEHDGFVLAESSAILEYLEDAFPTHPRILPRKPHERARARQVLSWIRSDDTLGLRDERSTHTMFYERAKTPLSERGLKSANKLLAVTDRLVASGKTTLFDAWCIADTDLAFILQRLALNGHDLPAKVRAYIDANWKRPSVKEYVEKTRPPYVPYG
jgi:glutathione S-transferase